MSRQIKLLKMHIETDRATLDDITMATPEITNVSMLSDMMNGHLDK